MHRMLTRAVGIFAWALVALAAVGLVASALRPGQGARPELKKGINTLPRSSMPVLVLEFVKKGEDAKEVVTNLGVPGVAEKLQSELRLDSLFITLYLLMYVGIALVLGRRGGGWVWVAAAAVVCAIGAAAADGVENLAMARAVERAAADAGGAGGAHDIDIKTPGVLKWWLSFAALGLLAFTFRGRGRRLADAAFWLTAVAALLGAAGLLVLEARPDEFRPLQAAFLLTLALIPVVAVLFTVYGERFDPGAA